jgi:hypothetical protein
MATPMTLVDHWMVPPSHGHPDPARAKPQTRWSGLVCQLGILVESPRTAKPPAAPDDFEPTDIKCPHLHRIEIV